MSSEETKEMEERGDLYLALLVNFLPKVNP